ncbi:AAA family ATPase [Fontisphaera persica]|uniref:AAA family ATPase n=1 Tax=Fontisphaera persica TaxID=2974023 RepID=UPI0024BFB3CD|nr:AAA family ATPase [Fontisphaera persica]WCJ60313.1 AAA family ATPase [Fontisphaera persica]
MEIKTYDPSEQVDPAVDLGAIPLPLPDICFFEDFAANPPSPPPQVIEGILHRGCKMLLGGTSKSNKSWCLLDLALSVASGQPWWGRPCAKMAVVYINFELQPWALAQRLNALCAARPEVLADGHLGRQALALWNLRGRNADLTLLRPKLEEHLAKFDFGLIILDPAYKVLGNRDENANGEIADLMNELEALAQKTGAALVVAHHFAKGDSTAKLAIDRMSGAGAWARDPDSIMILTPHEEPDCFTVTSILRNLPQVPEFVVAWEFPLMKVASDLNPAALRRPQGRNKVCTDKEFMDAVLTSDPKSFGTIVKDAASALNMGKRSVSNYLNRLMEAGLVRSSAGVYWVQK